MDVDLILYFFNRTYISTYYTYFLEKVDKFDCFFIVIRLNQKVRYFNRLSMISACRPGDAAPARME